MSQKAFLQFRAHFSDFLMMRRRKTCRLDKSGKVLEGKILQKSYWLRGQF